MKGAHGSRDPTSCIHLVDLVVKSSTVHSPGALVFKASSRQRPMRSQADNSVPAADFLGDVALVSEEGPSHRHTTLACSFYRRAIKPFQALATLQNSANSLSMCPDGSCIAVLLVCLAGDQGFRQRSKADLLVWTLLVDSSSLSIQYLRASGS